MSRLRQSDDGWDIAGSVGAAAVMVAAGRAAETGPGWRQAQMTAWRTTPWNRFLHNCFQLRETASHGYSAAGRAVSRR
jgi:hypothetical protein